MTQVKNSQNSTPLERSYAQMICFLLTKFSSGEIRVTPEEFQAFITAHGDGCLHFGSDSDGTAYFKVYSGEEAENLRKLVDMPTHGPAN